MKGATMKTYQIYGYKEGYNLDTKFNNIKKLAYKYWPLTAWVLLLGASYYLLLNLGNVLWVLSTPLVKLMEAI
jgi:uncharacterized membrane protein YjjP (DUF1212 family)